MASLLMVMAGGAICFVLDMVIGLFKNRSAGVSFAKSASGSRPRHP